MRFSSLSKLRNQQLRSALAQRWLERAIEVIYRPKTERLSQYFDASLAKQFGEWIWFDETSAVSPLTTTQSAAHEPQHPFAIID
jgi:erythromycin esterase-like protein